MQSRTTQRYRSFLDFLPEVSRFLVQNFQKKNLKVDKKGKIDLVTEADKGSEKRITRFIEKNFPEDSILGEEGTSKTGTSPYKWILDPLDGTTNFAHRIPLYAISVGLYDEEKKKGIFGIVDLPSLGHTYHGFTGKGAFKNRKKIQVSKTKNMIDAVLCTGFPYRKTSDDVDRILGQLRSMLINSQGIRRTGAAALDLSWVAEGRFDGFWEENLSPWDMAAGAVLVQEAGGEISTFAGNPFTPDVPNVVATNGILHRRVLEEFLPDPKIFLM